jgi:hypothetical protein
MDMRKSFLFLISPLAGRALALLFIAEPRVKTRVTSWEICGGRIATGAGFSPSFFGFPMLIVITPLAHTNLSPSPEMCYSTDQEARYHILGL